ncbi:ABC transporter ATP-binding protein [Leptospira sanjuanensis]|uniref:ABC transporter ATP-binding protein n=1 Tax=Leptospira sanjuanensis TaxID=2879643 RepID=UPI001EE8E853|nr:ATP-binding cassette domain-containing protein [Leptospira sanjuanensis]MCG6169066.1 ATP-binding cassette domain-containing protein [Leptospira sanjuanensis]
MPLKEQALFVCQDLSYSIGKKRILKQISFSLFRGELALLRGDNGAGKTTLLRAILNHGQHKDCFSFYGSGENLRRNSSDTTILVDKSSDNAGKSPDAGNKNVNLNDDSISKSNNDSVTQKIPRISYLGHELGLYTSLSLEENLRYFLSIARIEFPKEKVESLLRSFKLWSRREDPIFTFSRGMKQKAALVRALLTGADLILLDEPFTALDRSGLETAIRLLEEHSKNAAVLMVTHDPGIPFSRATKTLTIREGNLETTVLSAS